MQSHNSDRLMTLQDLLEFPRKNGMVVMNDNIISYDELLNVIDSITVVSKSNNSLENIDTVDRVINEIFLPAIDRHFLDQKSEWLRKSNKLLFSLINQLQAIAYLSGSESSILKDPKVKELFKLHDLEKFKSNNYLHKNASLKFTNFDRGKLVMELALRVMDLRKIQQRGEELCGPTSFFQMFAMNNPILYIEFVMGVAEKGSHTISLNADGDTLPIEVKTNRLFSRNSSIGNEDNDLIHDVDFISLAVFRDNQNLLFSFSETQSQLAKRLFGVTMSNEIEHWMKRSGFNSVHRMTLKSAEDIAQCSRLLKYGYNITFLSTALLADKIVHNAPVSDFEKLTQLLSGHFYRIKDIKHDKKSNLVSISIISWGEEVNNFSILFNELMALRGAGELVIGRSPQAADQQRSMARTQSHDNRTSPFEYCARIRSAIINEFTHHHALKQKSPQFFKDILNYIERNLDIITEDSWTTIAKKTQRELLYFCKEHDEYYHAFKTYLPPISSIIPEETIESANRVLHEVLVESKRKPGTNEADLTCIDVSHIKKDIDKAQLELKLRVNIFKNRDIDACRLLLDYLLEHDFFMDANQVLKDIPKGIFYNYEYCSLQSTFVQRLMSRILDAFSPEKKPLKIEDILNIRHCIAEQASDTERRRMNYLIDLLLHIKINADAGLAHQHSSHLKFPLSFLSPDDMSLIMAYDPDDPTKKMDNLSTLNALVSAVAPSKNWDNVIRSIRDYVPAYNDYRQVIQDTKMIDELHPKQLRGIVFLEPSLSVDELDSKLNILNIELTGHPHISVFRAAIIDNILELMQPMSTQERKNIYDCAYRHQCFSHQDLPLTRKATNALVRLFTHSNKDAVETSSQELLRMGYEKLVKSPSPPHTRTHQ